MLSTDPFNVTDILLDFFDLTSHHVIEKYILEHILTTRIGYSLKKNVINKKLDSGWLMRNVTNTKENVFKWSKNMKDEDVVKIQRKYKFPIRLLG